MWAVAVCTPLLRVVYRRTPSHACRSWPRRVRASASQYGGALRVSVLGDGAVVEWTVSGSTFTNCSAVAGASGAVRAREWYRDGACWGIGLLAMGVRVAGLAFAAGERRGMGWVAFLPRWQRRVVGGLWGWRGDCKAEWERRVLVRRGQQRTVRSSMVADRAETKRMHK